MKYRKYLIIVSIIYLLMIIVIFSTLGNAEKICDFLTIDSTVSEIGIFVFIGLYSFFSIALVNYILGKKGISDESLNGYNFLNFKKIFCEYFLNENSYMMLKRTNYFSVYEEKRGCVLTRFILVDTTKIEDKKICIKELEKIYLELLQEIDKNWHNVFIENFILIIAEGSSKMIESNLFSYTYGKALSFRLMEMPDLGSLILPVVINIKDDILYFSKYFTSPEFIERKKRKLINIIDNLFKQYK